MHTVDSVFWSGMEPSSASWRQGWRSSGSFPEFHVQMFSAYFGDLGMIGICFRHMESIAVRLQLYLRASLGFFDGGLNTFVFRWPEAGLETFEVTQLSIIFPIVTSIFGMEELWFALDFDTLAIVFQKSWNCAKTASGFDDESFTRARTNDKTGSPFGNSLNPGTVRNCKGYRRRNRKRIGWNDARQAKARRTLSNACREVWVNRHKQK